RHAHGEPAVLVPAVTDRSGLDKRKRLERNQRGIRHGVVSSFAIVGGFVAFALFGLWSLGPGRIQVPGWEFTLIWAIVTIGGAIVASLPVRFVFWLCQRTPRAVPDAASGSATQQGHRI